MSEPLPIDQLADAHTLLGLLGSFWGRTYAGREQVLALCAAAGTTAGQAQLDLYEALGCLSRYTVPTRHRERWRVFYLRRSARVPALPVFGGGRIFGDGLHYADVGDPGPYAWPCPLAGVATIFNRIASPSRSLTCGLDFTLVDGLITFRDDPFADPLLAGRDLVDDAGTVVDRELVLWCFAADSDREYIYEQYGYVLGLRLPSGPAYRDLVNALFDAFTGGTAVERLLAALAALTGTPRAGEDGEVVRQVVTDAHGLVIVTDRRAYRFPAEAHPVVTPGQGLAAGDPLVDTVEVHDLNRGVVPPGLTSLALGPGLLGGRYRANVTFPGRLVPLEVRAGEGGYTRVSWELGGYTDDVRRFWDEVHRRGVMQGQTLAHLLDVRPDPSGEPGPASLPETINPLEFLIGNLLRGGALFVRIRAGGLGPEGLGVAYLRLLRRITPPHTCLLTLIDLPPLDDFVTMGPDAAGPYPFTAAPTVDEWIGPGALQDTPSGVVNVAEACR